MKICSLCHIEKPLSDFHKRSDRAVGVQSHCKECQRKRKKDYLSTEMGKIKSKANSYCYYHNNKERALLGNKLWREENKEKRKEYFSVYESTRRIRNKEDIKRYNKGRSKKRYWKYSRVRLSTIMSTGIRGSLKKGKNGMHWEDLVGYTYDDLVKHLKKTIPTGYLWSDYLAGNTDLEIDHIIPISAFNFSDYSNIDFKRCWSLSNLRLLPKIENRIKLDHLNIPFQPSLALSL